MYLRILVILASVVLLSGCIDDGSGPRYELGGVDTHRSQPNEFPPGKDRAMPREGDPARDYKDQGAVYTALGQYQRAVEISPRPSALSPIS